MRNIIMVLALVMLPASSNAQPELPRNDVAVSTGWSGAAYDAQEYDNWRGSLLFGVSGGHYWTDHFKIEIEAAWNTRTNSDIYQELTLNGSQTYALANYRVGDVRLSLGQSYQFGRNDWVHPFIGAGADIIRRDTVFNRPAQTRPTYRSPSHRPIDVLVPAAQEQEMLILVRPFVKTGLKMYASDRAFFSTELKLGFAPDLDHAVWKLGVGFDF